MKKISTDIKASIELKYKKGNKVLFTRDSQCLQNLIRLIEKQKHRTLVMWALDCAEEPLALFEEKYPKEIRLGTALEKCEAWARGDVKMPEARKAILEAHGVAKEIEALGTKDKKSTDKVFIAVAHAIGHAGATVHVETHALGLVFYELSAIVFKVGLDKCDVAVSEKINYYYQRLQYWQENIDRLNVTWATFLLKEDRPNKEKMLNEKNARI